jgi:hypothetical protein
MNLMRKTATTLGGIFLAVLLIAALAPKATRAVAAALVQVTNATSNPVNVLDVAPLEAFQSSCFGSIDANPGFNGAICTISVPTGKRLVAQTVGMIVQTDPGVRVIFAQFTPSVGSNAINLFVVLPFTGNDGVEDNSGMSQELHFYAEGALKCAAVFSQQTTIGQTTCNVVGYLVDIP